MNHRLHDERDDVRHTIYLRRSRLTVIDRRLPNVSCWRGICVRGLTVVGEGIGGWALEWRRASVSESSLNYVVREDSAAWVNL